MLHRIRDLLSRPRPGEAAAGETTLAAELIPLRMLAAPLLLLTGIEATLDALARTPRIAGAAEGARWAGRASLASAWAPSLIAPMAAAAQIALLTRSSGAVSAASRVLNGAAVGAGVAACVETLAGERGGRRGPSLAPLALTAAGLLGLLLDRQERRIGAERERLERRARIVERLVPPRRTRLDRVVVHV